MNELQVKVYIQTDLGDDAEVDVTIVYTIERAFSPTVLNLNERQEVYITKMYETDSCEDIRGPLYNAIDTIELRKNILRQYRSGLDDDRADYERDRIQERGL